jgi:hypothetical protein
VLSADFEPNVFEKQFSRRRSPDSQVELQREHIPLAQQARDVEIGRGRAVTDLAKMLAVEDRREWIRRSHDHKPDLLVRIEAGGAAE